MPQLPREMLQSLDSVCLMWKEGGLVHPLKLCGGCRQGDRLLWRELPEEALEAAQERMCRKNKTLFG